MLRRQSLIPWISWKKCEVSQEFGIIKMKYFSSIRDWEFYELTDLSSGVSSELSPSTNSMNLKFIFIVLLCANPENPEKLYLFHTVLWNLSIHLSLSNYYIKNSEGWWLNTFKFQAHSKISPPAQWRRLCSLQAKLLKINSLRIKQPHQKHVLQRQRNQLTWKMPHTLFWDVSSIPVSCYGEI